ncbi:MAG: transcription-repair coupling factor [Clostridiales bacterium]|nr:transcription-repair coupling factor [Clostridiales bacterium]
MINILGSVSNDKALCEAFDGALGKRHLNIFGVAEEQKGYLIAALSARAGKIPAVITADPVRAGIIAQSISAFTGKKTDVLMPSELSLISAVASSRDSGMDRAVVASRILTGDTDAAVICAGALINKMEPVSVARERVIRLAKGDAPGIGKMAELLAFTGYERVESISEPGEFSVRGDILDIFIPGSDMAVRIDFWDDEIEQIKMLDTDTQRSAGEITEVTIYPAAEFCFKAEDRHELTTRIEEKVISDIGKMNLKSDTAAKAAKVLKHTGMSDCTLIENGSRVSGLARWLGILIDEPASILDYIDESGRFLIFVDELPMVDSRMRSYAAEYIARCQESFEVGLAPSCAPYSMFDIPPVTKSLDMGHHTVSLAVLGGSAGFAGGVKCDVTGYPAEIYNGRDPEFAAKIKAEATKGGRNIVIMLRGTERIEAFRDRMAEFDCYPSVTDAALPAGFCYPAAGIEVYSGQELFGNTRKVKSRSSNKRVTFFDDIKPGDYVVHDDYGIGRYEGLVNLKVGEGRKDYLKICYDGDEVLYILPENINILQKYLGPEGRTPKLSHIGKGDWSRAKARAQKSIKKIAYDLLKIYASRSVNKGFAALPDGKEQKEFEAEFPYAETEDQLLAAADIKRDMESSRPMDRLLCGDVGFGKTEVAFRAIFKSVMSGGQVIMLAPTTLLAQQHYDNFIERIGDAPINVVLLSRFVSASQIKKNLADIESGKADVIIGTHRVLSDDVKPRKLELLVVDEEQRFGVNHKEKIKAAKSRVDVLTLTATPIPRTLHMSLSGIRDISVIEQAPFNRRAVQTYVMEYNEDIVVQACLREIGRGGQIFWLHNRTSDIDRVAEDIAKLIPGARVTFAHGQMNEAQMSSTVRDFIKGKYDILVCTTIIENGVDMPNVNTLIVDDSDRFGLSQLYQIKGRVGRSDRQAYAYFTYSNEIMNETAVKRLEAIREFTELGSGIKIAMRDLEVRGAGSLLGAEQHGQMNEIGYELYSRMLDEEVKLMRSGGELPEAEAAAEESKVEIECDAYIPSSYIPDETGRMAAYRRIADIRDKKGYEDLIEELSDRYGAPVSEVYLLAGVSFIRYSSAKCGFRRVEFKGNTVKMYYKSSGNIDMEAIASVMSSPDYAARVRIVTVADTYLQYEPQSAKPVDAVGEVVGLLELMASGDEQGDSQDTKDQA